MTFSRTLLVEFQIAGVWTDVTQYVLQTVAVKITRGRADEAARVQPTKCTLAFNDGPTGADGDLSPTNPLGQWFGKIGRNTPIRVSIAGQLRFYGEVADWRPSWDLSHKFRVVTVTAAGIRRRLEQGTASLTSALRRYVEAHGPVGYWPLNDGELSTEGAPVAGLYPLREDGGQAVPQGWGKGRLAGWLEPGVERVLSAGTDSFLWAPLDPSTFVDRFAVDFELNTKVTADQGSYVGVGPTPLAGDPNVWQLSLSPVGVLDVWYPTLGAAGYSSSVTYTDGQPHHVRFQVVKSGSNALYTVWIDGVQVVNDSVAAPVVAPLYVQLGIWSTGATTDSNPSHAHLAVWHTIPTIADTVRAALGYRAEKAGRRVERLCAEEGLSFAVAGDLDDTAAMGPQALDTLVALFDQCAAADMGLVLETRVSQAVAYRTGHNLLGQTPQVTLDYAAQQVAPPFEPVEDDQAVRNRVTVKRRDGGEFTAELITGALSTQAPPDGVGVYDTRVTLVLDSDAKARDAAWWLVHLGTVDEPRFPTATVNFAAPAIAVGTTDADVLDIDLGDLLVVANLDAAHVYDDVRLIVHGYTETLRDTFGHSIIFNCAPASAYDVLTVDDATLGRVALDGQTVNTSASSSAGSLSVATTAGKPLLTTDAADLPMRIKVAGAVLDVTSVTGAASPQTCTTTLVNGVVKTLAAGSPVELLSRHVVAY